MGVEAVSQGRRPGRYRHNGYSAAPASYYKLTYHLECDTCDFARDVDDTAVAHQHARDHEATYPTHTVRLVEV